MDATQTHLRQMVTFDWSCAPSAVASSLKSLGGQHYQPGDVLTRIRADLDEENRGRQLRATNLLAAANSVEEAIGRGDVPTWAALHQIAQTVLDERVRPIVRSGPAGCQDRRYGYWPGLAKRFEAKLVADANDSQHPVIAAVRLYLDVIHLHPFIDGNARLARLCLLWWLASGGLTLPRLDPLVRLPKPPGTNPWVFVRLTAEGIHQCAA